MFYYLFLQPCARYVVPPWLCTHVCFTQTHPHIYTIYIELSLKSPCLWTCIELAFVFSSWVLSCYSLTHSNKGLMSKPRMKVWEKKRKKKVWSPPVLSLNWKQKHKIQDQTSMIINFDGHPNLTCYYFAMSNFALVTYPTSH